MLYSAEGDSLILSLINKDIFFVSHLSFIQHSSTFSLCIFTCGGNKFFQFTLDIAWTNLQCLWLLFLLLCGFWHSVSL